MICELLRKYPEGLTQNEIRKKTGIYKITIKGYLNEARKRGYVNRCRVGLKYLYVLNKRWLDNAR